ncbi:MAG TPA: SDR family oxidoreductase [Candidatus Baltobacteraceae bacterium]|nr:SDR family oxidoreductase [Candidatus Baltobacteraceae bacterium]
MNSASRAVLVTGASTGIGYAAAVSLAASGYAVYAGVRGESDAQRLRSAHPSIEPLLLDVTNANDIAAAAQHIKSRATPLHGVINNAGIAVAGPLEYLPVDEVRRQFEVNVFGALAVTQAVLPLLRESRGRVVFVSSVSGQIAPPYIGPYAASKFALEAMADALRMELSAFGIAVSVIQPGNVKTPIWQKGRDAKDAMVAMLPQIAITHYGQAIDAVTRVTQREEQTGIDAAVVAAAIERALTDAQPKARYPVGDPPGWQRRMASLLPERWRDKLVLRAFERA